MDENAGLRIAVVGAGGFAGFAVRHLLEVPGTSVCAVADLDANRASALAAALGAAVVSVDDAVDGTGAGAAADIVYIATPPSTHAPLGIRALRSGKHVLCEKPLATTVDDADELVRLARESDRFAVANLLQRYNPLAVSVAALVHEQLLGAPLRVTLENWAADQGLSPQHWFWDHDTSGGIFVEHGVHFFDLFASWFGPGTLVSSARLRRPASKVEEQVRCTLTYPGGVIADIYHGFHQADRLDRTQIRVLFERGDITLQGWVPTSLRIDALVDDDGEAALHSRFPGLEPSARDELGSHDESVTARFKQFRATRRVVLEAGSLESKQQRYGEVVRALFADQVAWIHDRQHRRRVDEDASRDAVTIAVAADQQAIELS